MKRVLDNVVDEIFQAALALPPGERERFVADRCSDDKGLSTRVMSLLTSSGKSDEHLEQRFAAIRNRLWKCVLGEDAAHEEDLSGRRIGVWRMQRPIARGGLATVYLAHRDDGAFEQRVAFKVLRRGLDTDDLIARFRAERQILSSLEHPSIARILDGGALPDGRPYLVLEYVDGMPITNYCDANRIDLHGRIRLIIRVAHALHHAHRHLVVHRDVKPSNILVSSEGHAMLLDFGIAKLLDPEALRIESALTRTGVSLQTPEYASPEQRDRRAVTTATDIYQIGTVLYELIAGVRPIVHGGDHSLDDPEPPSRRMRARGNALCAKVRGDLDAIVCKAMQVDPEDRYASADELAMDLERFLAALPVSARPATVRYRVAKLTKRRPWLVPITLAALLGIAGYVVTLTLYSERLAKEQQLAAEAQRFMVDLFRSPDPFAPADAERGQSITVAEALEIGEKRIREELADQPELRASLLVAISDVYQSLDQHQAAIELREEALALERMLYGDRSPQVLDSMRSLGGWYSIGSDLKRADQLIEEQLRLAYETLPEGSPALGLAETTAAVHAHRKGDVAGSRELLQRGIAKLRERSTSHARPLIDALIVSAEGYGMESLEEAFAAIEEAEQVASAAFGPDSLQAALVRIRLASSLTMYGDYDGSEHNFLSAIPVLEDRLGESHSSTLSALNNLGFLYHRRGDFAGAEQIHRRTLERLIAAHGPLHRKVADSYQNLAGAITQQGRFEESLPLHHQAYETYKAVLNEDNYLIAFPLLSTAYAELQRGRGADAEHAARAALHRFEATVPGTFLEGVARCLVGLSLEQQGNVEQGSAMVASSQGLMKAGSIPDPYPALCRMTDFSPEN